MKSLGEALVAAQQKMPVVHKNGRANYGAYVTLDELISKTRPVLNEHGLAITQFPAETTTGGPGLKTLLIHAETGETLESTVPLLLNGKSDMQALGGAITYARRYGWAAVLGIANDEDDDGNHVSAPVDRIKSGAGGSVGGYSAGTGGTGAAVPSAAAPTENQLAYLRRLLRGRGFSEDVIGKPVDQLTKAEASQFIEQLKDGTFQAVQEFAEVGATLLDEDSLPF